MAEGREGFVVEGAGEVEEHEPGAAGLAEEGNLAGDLRGIEARFVGGDADAGEDAPSGARAGHLGAD